MWLFAVASKNSPDNHPARGFWARFFVGFRDALWRLITLRLPRRLKLTREGKYFIAITFGVGFVGILTANNLLYVLLGVLLSLIVVSGLLSEASLRNLRVTRKLPLRAQVGRAHLVEIEVHNDKTRMPSYAIEVEDLRAGQPADKRCFFLKVSAGSSQVAAYRRIPARRGIDEHVGFRVATRFPFGFFEKSRELKSAGSLTIYPAVDQVILPESNHRGTHAPGGFSMRRGGGDELLGLRLMREGDDPRDIYWKRSTTGPKVILERAAEVISEARLTLDNVVKQPEPDRAWLKEFERSVREVASYAVAHLRRGEPVAIVTTGGESITVSPAEGADPTLRFLALIDYKHAPDEPTASAHRAGDGSRESFRPPQQSVTVAPVQLSRPARRSEAPTGEER